MARNSLEKGIAAAKSGNKLLARLHLLEAAERSPHDPTCWLWLAWAAESPEDAIGSLSKALIINPNHPIAASGMAWARGMVELGGVSGDDSSAGSPKIASGEAPPRMVGDPGSGLIPKIPGTDSQLAANLAAGLSGVSKTPLLERKPQPLPGSADPTPVFDPIPSTPFRESGDLSPPPPSISPNPASITAALTGRSMPGVSGADSATGHNDSGASWETIRGSAAAGANGLHDPAAPTSPPPGHYSTPSSSFEFSAVGTPPAPGIGGLKSKLGPAAADPQDPGAGVGFKGRMPLVLVVDDSPTVCKLVAITLSRRGYQVISAPDGIEAMDVISTNKPDLILLDITMPRLDGYKLCRLIKGHDETRNIPVIMLSGKDGFFDRARGKFAGCTSYITKPFDPESLIQEIEKHLASPVS